jgi:hypothetical protein
VFFAEMKETGQFGCPPERNIPARLYCSVARLAAVSSRNRINFKGGDIRAVLTRGTLSLCGSVELRAQPTSHRSRVAINLGFQIYRSHSHVGRHVQDKTTRVNARACYRWRCLLEFGEQVQKLRTCLLHAVGLGITP